MLPINVVKKMKMLEAIRNKSACANRLKAKITPTETFRKSQSVGQPLIVAE